MLAPVLGEDRVRGRRPKEGERLRLERLRGERLSEDRLGKDVALKTDSPEEPRGARMELVNSPSADNPGAGKGQQRADSPVRANRAGASERPAHPDFSLAPPTSSSDWLPLGQIRRA